MLKMLIRLALVAPLAIGASMIPAVMAAPAATGHQQLVDLFADWRTFNHPRIVHGKPDYSAAAMAAKARALPAFQRRLTAIKRAAGARRIAETTGSSKPR